MPSKPKLASRKRIDILGKTSRSSYVRMTRNFIDWGGKLPPQWPKCPRHGNILRPSDLWSEVDAIALSCLIKALAADDGPSLYCPYRILVALSGLPSDLAAAYRLGGPEGFADVLGIEIISETMH
jgi:hypothetical protein